MNEQQKLLAHDPLPTLWSAPPHLSLYYLKPGHYSIMSGSLTHILFEGASGYALFTVTMQEEVAAKSKQLQDSINDYNIFNRMVSLASFLPFTSAAQALENANDVSEGVLNDHLKSLLNLIVPSGGKKDKKVLLGVSERGLAGAIQGETGIPCDTGERALELIRGCRLHQEKLVTGLEKGDVTIAQLGLGHSYSRGKVKVCTVQSLAVLTLITVQRQPK
jgi:nucleolar protein 56